MTKKDINYIKKHLKLENCTVSKICGCLVNTEREKVCVFKENFLAQSDDDMEKYLKLEKKIFSNKLRDNSIISTFSTQEETSGESYKLLRKLANGSLSEEVLMSFYDKVIETYSIASNYLILLFFDSMDLPGDENSLDVYQYVTCLICPMKLSADTLGYDSKDNLIAKMPRSNIVSAPECGFAFPVLHNMQTDLHSIMLYSKKAKEPKTEILVDLTGCKYVRTATQKKELLLNGIAAAYGENGTDFLAEYMKEISPEDNEEIYNDVSLDTIKKSFENISNDPEATNTFITGLEKALGNEEILVMDIFMENMLERANVLERRKRMRLLLTECINKIEQNEGKTDLTEEIRSTFLAS